jgi:dolichyl-phosphate beta-glucosyltransferase
MNYPNPSKHICFVIPCYNEANKFLLNEYQSFINNYPNVLLCFVNDGSTDTTIQLITGLIDANPNNVRVVSYKQNQGKAEAVRRGFLYCQENFDFKYIGYLDADLSTSLEECVSLAEHLTHNKVFAFGSRILRIGSVIERKFYRFIIGRIIASCISYSLDLKVYDTQCGCKLFKKDISVALFQEQFMSRWLFDVEIFFRLIQFYGMNHVLDKMIEVPLQRWIEKGESKVAFTYFFKLWIDLYKINKKYKQ